LRLFKAGGITFRFHWVFIVLLFLLAFYGYLQETLLLFGLVLAHELVHMVAAKAHGLEIGDVELLPFGGVARIEDALEIDPEVETNVALAGPVFNFILVAVAMLIYANVPSWRENETFLFFIRCNLVLGIFNLLPALPLDGGRILRAKLAGSLGFQQATELAVKISQMMAVLLLTLGILLFYFGHFHLTLFVAAGFLYYAAEKERTLAMYAFIRSLSRKKKMFYDQGVMPLATLMALSDTPLKDVLRRFAMKKYHRIVVVDREGKVLGEAMESDVVDTIVRKGVFASAIAVLQRK
jgi:stage IV sporulation protein FB